MCVLRCFAARCFSFALLFFSFTLHHLQTNVKNAAQEQEKEKEKEKKRSRRRRRRRRAEGEAHEGSTGGGEGRENKKGSGAQDKKRAHL